MIKKTTQLRALLQSSQLELLMEAHHALSAKIVENTGFKGIWASGLSMSAAMGVRDNNEASWTQVLEVLEFMSDATTIPILLDGDTGYGNFNNARRLVKKLEQRGIAGVCIEDKLFPKTNSFIKGEAQPLADIEEFSKKIRAMKDTQKDDDFVVISRVEAFIAGWGLREALRRAESYMEAGCDAILIHSKKNTIHEIEAFMKEWGDRLPVVVVPTKYYTVPTEKLRQLSISMVIWANHNLRASITAMENVSRQIYEQESISSIENEVAPLEKVFALQGAGELADAEKIYLPQPEHEAKALILVRYPEAKHLVQQQMDQLNLGGIKNISIEDASNKNKSHQDAARQTDLQLLYQASRNLSGETIISFGEITYKPYLIDELLSVKNDIVILADADAEKVQAGYGITGTEPYTRLHFSATVAMKQFSKQLNNSSAHGVFFGLWKVSAKGAEILCETLAMLSKRSDFAQLTFEELFASMMKHHRIVIKYIKGQWLNVNDYEKLRQQGDEK
ncbi:phosphoenolpyruvate mutase [Bacillus benzoevorans]|uniref:phosphoenolpyruvate mutase n=1 Tax=Bacillus benzoevorans TaxID=1456 RepID=A0A7X0HT26_9BACI|nr:phosphoenolpyruvate mutase [Bacillus benzoevorans]MBB6445382.1 phosphoenolpyruvate phosphomutase [Bacillus benzoevorans]